jgi:CheY-like chemotaxis protein
LGQDKVEGGHKMAGEKVLIVEDNPLNMQLAVDLLEIAGYIPLQATTAEEGIKIARSELPNLILMDIGLPGIDGLKAAKILKQDLETKHIPVIALTAHAMRGDKEKVKVAGCEGYITKPIDTREFPKNVANYILPQTEGSY